MEKIYWFMDIFYIDIKFSYNVLDIFIIILLIHLNKKNTGNICLDLIFFCTDCNILIHLAALDACAGHVSGRNESTCLAAGYHGCRLLPSEDAECFCRTGYTNTSTGCQSESPLCLAPLCVKEEYSKIKKIV